jgi:hypothetical protein
MPKKKATKRAETALRRQAYALQLSGARQRLKVARANLRSAPRRAREACKRARARHLEWKRVATALLKKEIKDLKQHAIDWPKKKRGELAIEVKRRESEVCEHCSKAGRARVQRESLGLYLEAQKDVGQLEGENQARSAANAERRKTPRSQKLKADSPAWRRAVAEEESAEEVRNNLDTEEERALWDIMKGKIHAGPRMSRTEAFAHWMHDNSADVSRLLTKYYERLEREADREVARYLREGPEGMSATDAAGFLGAALGAPVLGFAPMLTPALKKKKHDEPAHEPEVTWEVGEPEPPIESTLMERSAELRDSRTGTAVYWSADTLSGSVELEGSFAADEGAYTLWVAPDSTVVMAPGIVAAWKRKTFDLGPGATTARRVGPLEALAPSELLRRVLFIVETGEDYPGTLRTLHVPDEDEVSPPKKRRRRRKPLEPVPF